MKKIYLFLLFLSFAFSATLSAQEYKHIQVVVKSGGNHEIKPCQMPDNAGNVTLNLGTGGITIIAHNYQEALEFGCEPLKLVVRNADDPSIIYASQTLTPSMALPLPDEAIGILCPEVYSQFTPQLNFQVVTGCGSDYEGSVALEYVVNYNYDSECAKLLFPEECYPDDGDDHEVEYEHIVERNIIYTCCGGPDAPIGDEGGGLEPKKTAVAPDALSLSLFPNPFQHQFELRVDAVEAGNLELAVYDSNNRQVYTRNEVQGIGKNQYRIDASQFANGFYYLRVKSGDQVIVKRLVKIQ